MERSEVQELVDGLCFAFNQPEMDDVMEAVRRKSYNDFYDLVRCDLTVSQILPVYQYLRETFESPDVDLVEVTRGQWSSLDSEVSYVARMGKKIARLRRMSRWWFGDDVLESLDEIQQIWKAVER